jgi:hypothetical protein
MVHLSALSRLTMKLQDRHSRDAEQSAVLFESAGIPGARALTPRRTPQRLRRLTEGADESAAHPFGIAEQRKSGYQVPELTRDVDIKLNARVTLRRIVAALSCSHWSLSSEVIYE